MVDVDKYGFSGGWGSSGSCLAFLLLFLFHSCGMGSQAFMVRVGLEYHFPTHFATAVYIPSFYRIKDEYKIAIE